MTLMAKYVKLLNTILSVSYTHLDYLEESPLGKAEWMVVLSEVTGKREKGEKAFAAIPVRYNAIGNIKHNRRSAEGTVGHFLFQGVVSVSYTHLDVYKRQEQRCREKQQAA